MSDLRTAAQAVLNLIDRMPNGVDCDEYDEAVEALRQALADAPADVPRITLDDAQWQAFLDKLDRPVQDKPSLAKLLRGDVDALIAEIDGIIVLEELGFQTTVKIPDIKAILDKYRDVK